MPGVRIENRQIRGPEQLSQIAAIRNQRVPDARAQGQAFTRRQSACALLHHEGHDAHQRREDKERGLFPNQLHPRQGAALACCPPP